MKKGKINKDIKETVIARIEAQTPSNMKLSVGSQGSLTKEELINHIKKGDEIGQQVVDAHLTFLKALANGKFVKAITSV